MPKVESTVVVPVPIEVAFRLSQTYGDIRYRWDPFVKEQHLLNGASAAAKGVQTFTKSRHGLTMISEYVSFRPPTQVGMKMVKGPWFFEQMSGGWSFTPAEQDAQQTKATWRYTFRCRPAALRPIAHWIGSWLLGRDIQHRITAFAAACSDPTILALLPPVAASNANSNANSDSHSNSGSDSGSDSNSNSA
jgi:ribosome-associated toxin RatA of RatAB toxin-antitoxin module